MAEVTHLLHSLRKAGFRLTPQREAICRLLAGTDTHPSAQKIFDELRPSYSSLSLATVYNTLDVLVQMGVVNALGGAGDGTEHYDADLEPHVNLACIECHRIIDLPSQAVHELEGEVAQSSGYKLLGARVMYYGLCPDCQQKSTEAGESGD
jgi:Fur family peroxide stress response transcriptional regulator